MPNDGRYGLMATPSDHAYPVLIAQKMNLPWSCHARPGAGNFEILNRLIGEISTGESSIYIINWTWIDRFSYISEGDQNPRHPFNPLGWRSIMPIDSDPVATTYYKNLHTQLRDKIESLTCIKTAIDCLRSNRSEFIMTWTDSLIWETEWHCPPSVCWLQNQIRPYLRDFDGTSFIDWSKQKGFKISDTMHPLEEAHIAAADYLLPVVQSLIKGDN